MDNLASVPAPSTLSLRLSNLAASVSIVAMSCGIYRVAPYNQQQLDTEFGTGAFSFNGAGFLIMAALGYSSALAVFFLGVRDPVTSKSLRCWQLVARFARSPSAVWRQRLSEEDRVAALTTLLKAFFGPLMSMWLLTLCTGTVANGLALAADSISIDGFRRWFDRHGFWFLMQMILFADVLFFTLGYLIELPALRNKIRSVDSTLTGWVAALLCYPPFNRFTVAILGSELNDFPQFADQTIHFVLNFTLLGLMAIYASASVALGFKASNLTHRGIVARGPYRVIRHPAYTCKNIAWWIGSMPLVSVAFAQSTVAGLQALASVAGWTLLYVLRAFTEEDHLRRVDGDYAAYAQKVRYRFVPKFF